MIFSTLPSENSLPFISWRLAPYHINLRYVQFYLDQIATSETVSLLYHLAMKGKTVRDAESHTHTEAGRKQDLTLLGG
jgi:hypothetical protein